MAKTNSKYWEKRAVNRMIEAERYSEANITRVYRIYDKANKDIDKMIDNVYQNYSKTTGLDKQELQALLSMKETDEFWKTLDSKGLKQYVKSNYKARITRLEKLKGELYARVKDIAPKETSIDTSTFKGVMYNSYNQTIYDTANGIDKEIPFNQLDDRTINQVLNYKWSGENYSQRIWTNTDILAGKIDDIINSAVMTGQSLTKTSKEIQQAFGVSKYYADRLIRTETNYFHNESEYQAYNEMGVEEYVFVSVLDNRTSEECQNHDGKRYKMSERKVGINYPPLHPNCRSTVRAWLGEEFDPKKRRVNGEVIDYVNYKDYEKYNLTNIEDIVGKNNILNIDNNIMYVNSGANYDLKSLKWLPKDIQEPVITQIESLIEKYPKVGSQIRGNGGIDIIDGINKSKPNTKGYTTRDNSTLFVSSKHLGDREKYIRTLDSEIKSGSKMAILRTNYDKYTITHEWGHVIENALLKSDKSLNYHTIKNDIIDIAIKQSGKEAKDILTSMSIYGMSSDAEFFAEAFTMAELGGKNNVIGKAMRDYLKGVM